MIEFTGIEFRHVDNRLMASSSCSSGLSGAAMFGPNGEVLQPSEVLLQEGRPGRARQLSAGHAT